jgi:hypothetical protein
LPRRGIEPPFLIADRWLLPHALERRRQAGAGDRLQQVVGRRQLEGVHRVVIEGRAEDDVRARLAERGRDVESGGARHLDVQEDDVRRDLGDALRRLAAVLGLAGDLHVGMRRQQLPQPRPRRLLIVHE